MACNFVLHVWSKTVSPILGSVGESHSILFAANTTPCFSIAVRIAAGAEAIDVAPLSYCHSCQFEFREAVPANPIVYDADASSLLLEACRQFEHDGVLESEWDLGHFAVMHQLCRIMTTQYKHAHLREFVLDQIGVPDIELIGGRVSFEMRAIQERHHLLQLTGWLMADLEPRLTAAWRSKAVRYNLLLKDFNDPPVYYHLIAEKFSKWRDYLGE